ncbi:MAG: Asp-tRNA(Asn)/Glu-tRNA(Gln) amidotransferase subunit GatB [Patescibacteria group bacterium]|nr:Asp-tRNA(Asn)/Glu-tRNA(Gln) amidotransferase subunit GatB [Patescibacteria group bacterium]
MNYRAIIGLEIHIELKTKTKMFCGCLNNPDEKEANVNICPVCTAQPGTLPVINEDAVKKTIKTGLALNCKIAKESKFDRKNYFYPDLPKGYQISQYDKPFCEKGFLEIFDLDNLSEKNKKIRITRIHLEEDTGRLIHSQEASLVDYNRAGVPLMEMVTEPDFRTAQEAKKFAEELQLILRYLNVSDANMEKGQMRVEVNISLVPEDKPSDSLGTKVEVKNLNSFRVVEQAINYEIKRQKQALDNKEEIFQETRGWDESKNATVRQRKKEGSRDYRYFPEPDLPTVYLKEDFIQEVRAEIPELPAEKRKRFKEEYNLLDKEIEIFTQDKDLSAYFEKVISELKDWTKTVQLKTKISKDEENKLIKLASNYIITDLQSLLKNTLISDKSFLITSENFAEFISLIYQGKITSRTAKQILEEMFKKGSDPSHIIEEKGLSQLFDEKEILGIIEEVISKNKKPVEDYKKGKENALQFLIGQVMAKSKGRANPDMAKSLLKNMLEK